MRSFLQIAIVLIILASDLSAEIEDRIVDAVGFAESRNNPNAVGDGGSAISAFQIWSGAWADANAWRKKKGQFMIPRSSWRDHHLSREICRSYLEMLQAQMKDAGIKPTPERLYLAYTMGFSGAKRIGFSVSLAPRVKQAGVRRFLSAL